MSVSLSFTLTLQVSLPFIPPAQMNIFGNSNLLPSRVFLNFIKHSLRGTIGTSTFFKIFWYLPFLPMGKNKIEKLLLFLTFNLPTFYIPKLGYNKFVQNIFNLKMHVWYPQSKPVYFRCLDLQFYWGIDKLSSISM